MFSKEAVSSKGYIINRLLTGHYLVQDACLAKGPCVVKGRCRVRVIL